LIYSVLNLTFAGGFERWVSEIAPRLINRGHKVTVVTTRAGDIKDKSIKPALVDNGIKIIELDNYTKPFTIPKIKEITHLLKIAKEHDVLYFNNAFAGNELLMKALNMRTKIVAAYHGIFPNVGSRLRVTYYSTINRVVSSSFNAHHVVNKERERMLRSWGYRNVYYIPNGVDTSKFHLGKKEERFTVLFVGRLDYQKGFDIFARIIKLLNEQYRKEICFIIVGTGPLSYIAERLKTLYENVEWNSYLKERELVRTYQRAHVLLAPSRFEEFLITSIEAQACGTPVIASDLPGPRENIVDGQTGFLVKPSIGDFVRYILFFKKLWDNSSETYYKYSQNARKNALKYDWRIIVDKIEGMLIKVARL
jgi:glycosyltransferase involved in cell wall biosynthesis